jgi:ferredoxin-type protein NapG
MSPPTYTRRQCFVTWMQRSAAVATGGLLWTYVVQQQTRAAPIVMRPPGALPEPDFQAACIKCGQCVQACPFDILHLAATGDTLPLGTPYFVSRQDPCRLCPDIPCLQACPTGALDPHLGAIADARMGLAVIDSERCLSWQGLRCEICYRVCPLQGKAITVEYYPRSLSKHAKFVPVVHSDGCTGCGMCEHACPLHQAAIRVLPPALVQGEMGEHYRLGWTVDTPITQQFQPQEAPATPLPQAPAGSALDYLNQGETL